MAVKCYLKSISLAHTESPVFGDIIYNLGHFFQSLAEFKFARLCYLSCLDSDPEHLEARNNLSICQMYLDCPNLALKGFEEISDQLYEGQFNQALMLIRKGNFQDICPIVQKVIQKGKDVGHIEAELISNWFQKLSKTN
jgi:tetratricopeptide (TPR) repeat protein